MIVSPFLLKLIPKFGMPCIPHCGRPEKLCLLAAYSTIFAKLCPRASSHQIFANMVLGVMCR